MGYLLGKLIVFAIIGLIIYYVSIRPIIGNGKNWESLPATSKFFKRINLFSIVIITFHLLGISILIIKEISLMFRIYKNSDKLFFDNSNEIIDPASYWVLPTIVIVLAIIIFSLLFILIKLLNKNLKIHELGHFFPTLAIQSSIGLLASLFLSGDFYYNRDNYPIAILFLIMALGEAVYLIIYFSSISHFKKNMTKRLLNKFDDFYSKKSTNELLERLRIAKITPAAIEKEWYDGLITHLQKRELTENEKTILNDILYSSTQ